MHILISKLSSDTPSLGTSTFAMVDDSSEAVLGNFNMKEYFCGGGHSFTLAFTDHLTPPHHFECPTCTAYAIDDPEYFTKIRRVVKAPNVNQTAPHVVLV